MANALQAGMRLLDREPLEHTSEVIQGTGRRDVRYASKTGGAKIVIGAKCSA